MASFHHHIIRNLNLEVEFQDQADAFELRNWLVRVCKSELLPALENLFNKKSDNGKIIRAEKIVFDLGVIDLDNWNQTLVEQVIQQLAAQFSKATPLLTKTIDQRGNDGVIPIEREGAPANVTEISEEENIVESTLFFLKNGLLPWYTIIKSQREFVQHLTRLIQQPGSLFSQVLLGELKDDEYARKRLVDQVPAEITESILVLSGVTASEIKMLQNCWTKIFEQTGIFPATIAKQVVHQAAVGVVSQQLSKRPHAESISEYIIQKFDAIQEQKVLTMFAVGDRSFDQNFSREEKKVVRFIAQRMKEIGRGAGDVKDVHAKRNSDIRKPEKTKESAAGTTHDMDTSRYSMLGDSNRSNHSTSRGVKDRSTKKSIKEIAEATEDGCYINNAGLVILNPFLLNLFENAGYLEEKKWISESHQQRALLLTQYLVTGKQEYSEFDMLLNKILTGYTLENSLPADIMLSDFEIREGQEVLQSVLNHWKALKNTSIAGLQATFLQREGKLLYNDERWLLQVELQTVDILLNKLPWGISIIKLPWMENRVHVEWT